VLKEENYNKLLKKNRTALAIFEPAPSNDFFEIKTSNKPPPTAQSICITMKALQSGARLDLIIGDFELIKFSLIDDGQKLHCAIDYFKRFISTSREHYDVIVIDCNPSSSFLTQCALAVSTHVLSPVRPDKYSVIGVQLVNTLLDRLGPNPKPEHLIIMNYVNRGNKTDPVEVELRSSKFGSSVLANRLHKTSLLASKPSYTGFATDNKVSWSQTLTKELASLSKELAIRLGVQNCLNAHCPCRSDALSYLLGF
jgi:chromosome partitioning protein